MKPAPNPPLVSSLVAHLTGGSAFPALRSIFITALLVGAALPSHAQIAVVNETAERLLDTAGEFSFETTPYVVQFNATGADKLIVTLSSEIGSPGGPPVITYDGNALTRVPTTFDLRNLGIWYLDLAGTTYAGGPAALSIDMTAYPTVNGIGYAAVAISGSVPGAFAGNFAAGTSVALNTPVADSFVVTNYAANGAVAVSVPAGHTSLYAGDIGSAVGGASYQNGLAAGPQTLTWGGTVTSGDEPRTSAAAFIPASALPVIVSTNPADNAVGVPVGTNLVAKFSEPVVAGTGFVTLKRASDNSTVQSFNVTSEVTISGQDLTINPTNDLAFDVEYYVLIDSGAFVDTTGGGSFAGISNPADWSFTTGKIFAVNSGKIGGSAPGTTVTQSIDVGAGADMLIVMASMELGNLTSPTISATYGGVTMNQAAGGTSSTSRIWYLDLATPGIIGTDVVVDLSGYGVRNGFAAGWVSIDGNLGAGESITLHSTGSSASSATVDLTTTVKTFNVVNFNANNGGAITVNSPNPTVIYSDTDIGSARGAAAYASAVAAGTSTYQWTIGGVTTNYRRIDAAAFSVTTIPGGTAFEDWAATGTLGPVTFDGDTNVDGVRDGMAFLLGAENPDDDATGLLPSVSRDGSGGLVLTFDCLPIADRGDAKLYVEHSSDLGILDDWLATVDQVPDATDAVPDNGVTFEVTPGSPKNAVIATIAPSEAAGGKLFGRLRATEN